MITGIGVPVNLELEAVTVGAAFKSNFILPQNVSDFYALLSDPFHENSHLVSTFKRSIQDVDSDENGFDAEQNETFERHQVRAQVVESGTEPQFDYDDDKISGNKFASTRWLVYKGLAEIAERYK